tara:strand:- start:55 stop:375 length:321 start_codon:yes stop_codon:yes gene_type:complete
LDRQHRVKVSFVKSKLQIYVDVPHDKDLADEVVVAKMTRNFLRECETKFNASNLKYIFVMDGSKDKELQTIFDVRYILNNEIEHVMVSANPNVWNKNNCKSKEIIP